MAIRETQRKAEGGAPAGRAGGSGVTWLVVLAAFALGAVAGFGGSLLAFAPDPASSHASAPTPDRDAPPADPTLPERMLSLDPFLVNLAGEDAARYLKVRIALETESPARREALAARLPQVRDGILSVLTTRDVVDVTSVEGKTLLKQDLQDRLNGLLDGGGVRSVLFTEFVVQ